MGIGFLSSGQTMISDFVQDVPLTFTKRKRAETLMTIRDIMMSNDTNTVEVEDATERGKLERVYFAQQHIQVGSNHTPAAKAASPRVSMARAVKEEKVVRPWMLR